MPPTPRITATGPQTWVNAHGNITAPVAQLIDLRNPLTPGNQSTLEAYNAMTAALQELITQALAAPGHLRATGAGWSLSEAAVTDGWLLNTQPLDFTFRLEPQVVHADAQERAASLRFVQCGIGIAQLSALLRQDGLSLRTSGASNGQTLAGAISTGTHGAALDVGAVHDAVCGLHLIPEAARSLWLERVSRPVVTPAFVEALGAELQRDDALFEAALVSFGSFGILHGLLIETEPLFLLEAYRQRLRLTDQLWQAISTLTFDVPEFPHPGERPYHFQVVFNPHDVAGGVFVTIMYKRSYREDYTPPPLSPERFAPGDDAAAFIGVLTDSVPAAIPVLTQQILARAYAPYAQQEGTVAEIFSNTDLRGRLASTAVGLHLDHTREAVEAVLAEQAQSGPVAVVVSLRYVQGSSATLAFTHFPTTCVLELDGVHSSRTNDFYARVWERLERQGIPYTFHWGKQHNLDAVRVRRMYGARVEHWLAARRHLLGAAERRLFANALLERLALDG
jgi:FAD binding domain/D-arabinono-1,4-lactone oxidase